MITALPTKPANELDNKTSSTIPKSRASKRIENNNFADNTNLHSTEINSKKFRQINLSSADLEKETKKILARYKVDSDKYHRASLSKDGNTLVVVHDGKTTLAQNFGGASKLSRFFYKIFGFISRGFGAANKNIASAKYKEFFNNHDSNEKEVTMVMEPLGHLYKGLSQNHYHGITVFHRDNLTGKFSKNPSVVSIIDSYQYIFAEHMKNHDLPPELKSKQSFFDNGYALDKTIPIDMDKAKNFGQLYNEIIEGFYNAQGFSFMTVPGQVHKNLSATSADLSFTELPWHRVQQSADKHWRVATKKQDINDAEFANAKDKEFYLSKVNDNNYTYCTIVRPKADHEKPIEPLIGFMENWSQMYSGNSLRAKDKDDKRLVELAQGHSAMQINKFNQQFSNLSV
jgi:hypothetical protein